MATGKELLVALINKNNPQVASLSAKDVEFTNLLPDEGPDWNTKVTATAAPNTGFNGTLLMHYKRANLSVLGVDLKLYSEHAFTTQTLLKALNGARANPALVSDFEPFSLPILIPGVDTLFTLRANPQSYVWMGQITVTLKITGTSMADILMMIGGKQDLAEKAVDFSVVNHTLYPTVRAVKTYVDTAIEGVIGDIPTDVDGGSY